MPRLRPGRRVFFAFSTFVMRALGRLPAADGIAAMQSINIAAINLWFMGLREQRGAPRPP